MAKSKTTEPDAGSPAVLPTGIPEGRTIASRIPTERTYADSDFCGLYRHEKDDELYALCVHEPDGYERTLKNTVHFWQGTHAQFKATFEKV